MNQTIAQNPFMRRIEAVRSVLNSVPYTVLALPLRAAIATVFWNSGTTKLASWDTTLELFSEEYKVPLELSMPMLLVLGLCTRGAALVLLGMTTVIEIFVYPQAWPTHIQWAAMLLVLLCRGPGACSLDALLARWLRLTPVRL